VSSLCVAPPPLTKLELIKQRKERARIDEARAKLDEDTMALEEAAASMNLGNSMEMSLQRGLRLQRSIDEGAYNDAVKGMAAADEEAEKIMYDEDDTIDLQFWDSGVTPPNTADVLDIDVAKKLSAKEGKAMRAMILKLEQAFRELDLKFVKRALYAYDLKQVYIKKRNLLKETLQQLDNSNNDTDMVKTELVESKASAATSKASAEAATSSATAMKAKLTRKKCGCPKNQCDHSSCGCRRRGDGCDSNCGCSGPGVCMNPHTYKDEIVPENVIKNFRARGKAMEDAKKEAARIARIESGV